MGDATLGQIAQEAPTLIKLDRVMCVADWEVLNPHCILESEATELSDHCPSLLGLNVKIDGKKRFHFERYWAKLLGFIEVVAESWNNLSMLHVLYSGSLSS